MRASSEAVSVPNTCAQGAAARDALCKHLYSQLFEWLVRFVNSSLSLNLAEMGAAEQGAGGVEARAGAGEMAVNILDIFGFELFERNSFEQFCINYANERLQEHFNRQMLKVEQEEYRAEGIPWECVAYADNEACVALIDGRPAGLLALLDEEGRIPRGSDEGFMDKVRARSSAFLSLPLACRNEFAVRHYAGKVTYDSRGFLEKNRDVLLTDLRLLLRGSASAFLRCVNRA